MTNGDCVKSSFMHTQFIHPSVDSNLRAHTMRAITMNITISFLKTNFTDSIQTCKC